MSKKPIEFFKTEEAFLACCKWWQHKLFLDDWFIKYEMVDELQMVDDQIASGVCAFSFNTKEAKITVYNSNKSCKELEDEAVIVRNIAELNIVHELLHLKNSYMMQGELTGSGEIEGFHDWIVHQELEVMAKSLLMVKYNVEREFFLDGGINEKK